MTPASPTRPNPRKRRLPPSSNTYAPNKRLLPPAAIRAIQSQEFLSGWSAMCRALSLPDILLCIRDYVHHKSDLKRLSLVNRVFRDIFAPKLFDGFTLSIAAFIPGAIDELARHTHLRHVPKLSFPEANDFEHTEYYRACFGREPYFGTRFQARLAPSDQEDILAVVKALIRMMPRLAALHWDVNLLDYDHLADTKNGLAALLQDTPDVSIRSLSVQSPQGEFSEYELRQPLNNPVFFNLRALSLWNIPHVRRRMGVIARALSRCPHLVHLALSSPDEVTGCLEELCDQFRSCRARPFRLQSLQLGNGFHLLPPRLASERWGIHIPIAMYLQKLTDLRCMLSLKLTTLATLGMSMDALTAQTLPNLQHIGMVDRKHTHDMVDYARGLFQASLGESSEAFQQQLVMTVPRINVEDIVDLCGEHNLGGVVSFLPRPPPSAPVRPLQRVRPLNLPRLRLFGVTVWWPRLGDFCKNALVHMGSLEHLKITTFRTENRSLYPRNDPNNASGLRAGAKTLREVVGAAQAAADACPMLKYIKIEIDGKCCYLWRPIVRSWRVTREVDSEGNLGVARLQELCDADDEEASPPGFGSTEDMMKKFTWD